MLSTTGVTPDDFCQCGIQQVICSINQSMEFTVRVGEPDVKHRTSWLESTGETLQLLN